MESDTDGVEHGKTAWEWWGMFYEQKWLGL